MTLHVYLELIILVFRMGSALLSRFDVVFILLDIPDESHDRLLSEHVMANRTGGSRSSSVVTRTNTDLETSILLDHSDMTLSECLQVNNTYTYTFNSFLEIFQNLTWINAIFVQILAGETIDPIPPCLLRKYISYARQYVHPKLSPEAAQTIQDFYLSLRAQSHSPDSTPITTRQLESLIRLTEVGLYIFIYSSVNHINNGLALSAIIFFGIMQVVDLFHAGESQVGSQRDSDQE